MIPASQWSAPWTTDDRCTRHQAELAEKDLSGWLMGAPHPSFDAFRKLVEPISNDIDVFIEVGCGCGYYFDVLMSFATMITYSGYDISEHMVRYANARTPGFMYGANRFHVADAANLMRLDSSVDCVCLAAVLQHMPDYRPAIREAIRVSRRYVILHRVEATSQNTFEYVNEAYSTRLPTRIINESELLAFCGLHGLTMRQQEKWGVGTNRWNCSLLFEKT